MKFKAFLPILFLISINAIAIDGNETSTKSISVEILVIDGATEEPILAAKVKLSGFTEEIYTDFDGMARLDNISVGAYEFEVTFISYEKYIVKSLKIDQYSHQILVKLYP
jgi:hypothetical protein